MWVGSNLCEIHLFPGTGFIRWKAKRKSSVEFPRCNFVLTKGLQSWRNGTYNFVQQMNTCSLPLCNGHYCMLGSTGPGWKSIPPGNAFVIWVLRMEGNTVESSRSSVISSNKTQHSSWFSCTQNLLIHMHVKNQQRFEQVPLLWQCCQYPLKFLIPPSACHSLLGFALLIVFPWKWVL